jgi:uncharacterized membrane protein YedE/YeeE
MNHWVWWLSGLALAGVPIVNWLLVRRLMAVSGRYTALVDRVRLGAPEAPGMTEEELLLAVRAATADAFGRDALEPAAEPDAGAKADLTAGSPRTAVMHAVFLVSLLVGGFVSVFLAGDVEPAMHLHGGAFTAVFGSAPWVTPFVLLSGGVLVGFGTRMAAGCTSGHGLCGVSRGQLGSIAATAAFFGMGVAVSLAMEWL